MTQSDAQLRTREAQQAAFLAAYRHSGNITAAAEAIAVGRTTVYDWRDSDEAFALQLADATEEACDRLEIEARRRAVDGLPRKKFTKDGDPIIDPETGGQYVEYEYSDGLMLKLLAAHRPGKYGSKVDVTSGGQPLMKAYAGFDIDQV